MEINMLSVYFASLVMCVVIGCILLFVKKEPEVTKEKKRKSLFICIVVGVIPILNFVFCAAVCLTLFIGIISGIVKGVYECFK